MTTPAIERISVCLDDAAVLTGVSRVTIQRAIRAGNLIAHYPTSRPVILVDELRAWIAASPTSGT